MNEPVYRIHVRRGDRSAVAEVTVLGGRAVHAWGGDPAVVQRCEQVYERWRRGFVARSPEVVQLLRLVPSPELVDESAEVRAAFLTDALRSELQREGYDVRLEDDPLDRQGPDFVVS
ncbi:hypothetical protein OO015_13730 (plasmid) [Thermomicrobium sp. 4228-Ro]|uniref:hypothetical protein n=1 Tax=Thermomicrobium sp. 4228-Ro TaxID=2993937 RepID=UPI00224939DF|nr:hypothetical protein [Thermomicrobium sp. 4228-Ro]MCX2728545.1 hypothetical protein [Thermomicrobium sp. 4228-Ro]